MIVPEFMRFYSYSLEEVFKLPARVFFTLVNSMYQLQAKEMLVNIQASNIGIGGDKDGHQIKQITEQYKGKEGVLSEIRNVKQ